MPRLAALALTLAIWTTSAMAFEPLGRTSWLPGVNLAGGEFNGARSRLSFDYTYPTEAEIDYFTSKGFRLFRIPFLGKRVLAQGTGTAQDLAILTRLVRYAADKNAMVVLDLHQYGSVEAGLVGRNPAATQEFAEIWRRLAAHFREAPNVLFGLMNEPHQQTAQEWLVGANAAIATIRVSGAKQLILVPGSHWDGAHSWVSSGNAATMLSVIDPVNNYAYEVHQYLDSDNSGTHPEVIRGAGSTRLVQFTDWARQHGKKGFLGEFGWADNSGGHTEGANLVGYMSANRDVWLGWAYWAAGPWWGEYMYTLEPKDGSDRPQMQVLLRHIR